MSHKTKFRFMVTMLALMGCATAASAASPAPDTHCVPGMTAATSGVCSLQGYHWALTTVYFGNHGRARSEWMLLRNG
jgi:hypothetical protein